MKLKRTLARLLTAVLVVPVVAILFVGAPALAATGGPDSFGYTFVDSTEPGGPAYNWIEISGTGTQVLASTDDEVTGNINLGFFFNFYGTDYSQLAIANNGLLFSAGTTFQYTNDPITQSPGVHGFISPFWDDLVTWGTAGAIYYQTLGTAPNRMFVVEWWNNEHYYSSTSGVTFEAILYEGSNNILFQYSDVYFGTVVDPYFGDNPPFSYGASATVGIEGPTGNVGLQYSYNQPIIIPQLAILFTFPQSVGVNLSLSKQGPATAAAGSQMTYTLEYQNIGDTTANNVMLLDTLPMTLEFVSASDGGSYDSNTRIVTWDIGDVLASETGSVNLTVLIPSNTPGGTIIQNDAEISTSIIEVRYDDNEASVETTVSADPILPPDIEVGGEVYPANKLALLAPWIALAAVIIAGATVAVRRRRIQS